jgi:hypothetical protein
MITHFFVITQCLFFINICNAHLNWNISFLCRVSIAITTDEGDEEDVDDSEPSVLVSSIMWVHVNEYVIYMLKGIKLYLSSKIIAVL